MTRLTDHQRDMAAAELQEGWFTRLSGSAASGWLRGVIGRDGVTQEAALAVVVAATRFDPDRHPGVPFAAYAVRAIRFRLGHLRAWHARRAWAWAPMPTGDGGETPEPEDRRRDARDPALRLWCSDEYAGRRRGLDRRTRLLLYLRCVEGWSQAEVADALDVSESRVRQLESRAKDRLRQEGRGK